MNIWEGIPGWTMSEVQHGERGIVSNFSVVVVPFDSQRVEMGVSGAHNLDAGGNDLRPNLLPIGIGQQGWRFAQKLGKANYLGLGLEARRGRRLEPWHPNLHEKHEPQTRLELVQLIKVSLRSELSDKQREEVSNQSNVFGRLALLHFHHEDLQNVLHTRHE